ncbi:MAG: thermonuclease family protein [Myxococcota bacterium]
MSLVALRRLDRLLLAVSALPLGFALGCCEQQALPAPGTLEIADGGRVTVIDIVKGDELVVEVGRGQARVRLVGLHAFDPRSPDPALGALGEVASQAVRARLVGKPIVVHLEHPPRDTYGRYLAYAEQDGTDVNRALLDLGLAMLYDEYPFGREALYRQVEQAARARQLGLWVKPNAVAVADGLKRQWAEARTRHTK